MTPQIELRCALSDDGTQYIPVVAALAGFPWSDNEKGGDGGLIANCPDAIVGCDIEGLLAKLTGDNAPTQVVFPFKTTKIVTRGKTTRQQLDKKSSWVLDVSLVTEEYQFSDPTKSTLSTDTVTAAIVQVK